MNRSRRSPIRPTKPALLKDAGGCGIPRKGSGCRAYTLQQAQTNMYHGSGAVCIPLFCALVPDLSDRTPFEQIGARPRNRIVEMVGTDPQRVAQAAGSSRQDLLAENRNRAMLFHWPQHDHLGIGQVSIRNLVSRLLL